MYFRNFSQKTELVLYLLCDRRNLIFHQCAQSEFVTVCHWMLFIVDHFTQSVCVHIYPLSDKCSIFFLEQQLLDLFQSLRIVINYLYLLVFRLHRVNTTWSDIRWSAWRRNICSPLNDPMKMIPAGFLLVGMPVSSVPPLNIFLLELGLAHQISDILHTVICCNLVLMGNR